MYQDREIFSIVSPECRLFTIAAPYCGVFSIVSQICRVLKNVSNAGSSAHDYHFRNYFIVQLSSHI